MRLLALAVLGWSLVAPACTQASRGDSPSARTGSGSVPEFEAVDENGVRFKLSDYRGKVVVLDFWGYW